MIVASSKRILSTCPCICTQFARALSICRFRISSTSRSYQSHSIRPDETIVICKGIAFFYFLVQNVHRLSVFPSPRQVYLQTALIKQRWLVCNRCDLTSYVRSSLECIPDISAQFYWNMSDSRRKQALLWKLLSIKNQLRVN